MGVIIDGREPGKLKNFLAAKGLKFEIRKLETGDVVIWNDDEPQHHAVIERKRLDDLISSYYSGRIADQFERLSEEKFAILIITGNLEDATRGIPHKVMFQVVEEVISMAVINYNFRSVIWMIDKVADAHFSGFATMIKCIQKIVDGQLDAVPLKRVKLSKDLRVNALRQMLGLSANVAKALLRKHGTVFNVLKLSDTDFLKINGIGPAKVRTIRHILSESINRGNFDEQQAEQKCSKCGKPMTLSKMPGGNVLVCKYCMGLLARS